MCTLLLPPGVNPIAVNKYIISILRYYGKHPVELKIDIHVHRICVTIKYCCIVIVIHALFNPQFLFLCGEIVNFQFCVWICMWARYCSENGLPPQAEHVTCLPASHSPSRAVPVFLSQSHRCVLFFTSSVVIGCNRYLCLPLYPPPPRNPQLDKQICSFHDTVNWMG
jgi:hypothetical protein